MSFTIYTISDPETATAALRAIAAFFGADDWVGGLAKLALLGALLIVLGGAVVQNGLRLDRILLQLIIFYAAFIPKGTLVVEHFNHDFPTQVVDNVPYGVAVPAAVASTFALYMTNKMETVMIAANANYRSIVSPADGRGPTGPYQLLLRTTVCGREPLACVSPNLAMTVANAVQHCGAADPARWAGLRSAPDLMRDWLAGLDTSSGLTVAYNSANPYNQTDPASGVPVSCDALPEFIESHFLQPFESGHWTPLAGDLTRRVFASRDVRFAGSSAQPPDDDPQQLLDAARYAHPKEVVSDAVFMRGFLNYFTYSAVSAISRAGITPVDQAVRIETDRDLLFTAEEATRNATTAQRVSPAMMDVVFFVFVASAPIVLFVVLFQPTAGLQILGGYLVFGLWSQSWIPMQAIAYFWMQTKLPMLEVPAGLSAEAMNDWLRNVASALVAAGQLLAVSPILTFALLTGSMYAMVRATSALQVRADTGSGMRAASQQAQQQSLEATAKTHALAGGALAAGTLAGGTLARLVPGAHAAGIEVSPIAAPETYAELAPGQIDVHGSVSSSASAARTLAAERTQEAQQALTRGFEHVFSQLTSGSVSREGAHEHSGGTAREAGLLDSVGGGERRHRGDHSSTGDELSHATVTEAGVNVGRAVAGAAAIADETLGKGRGRAALSAMMDALSRGDRSGAARIAANATSAAPAGRGGRLASAFAQVAGAFNASGQASDIDRITTQWGTQEGRDRYVDESLQSVDRDAITAAETYLSRDGGSISWTGSDGRNATEGLAETLSDMAAARDAASAAEHAEQQLGGSVAAQLDNARLLERLGARDTIATGGVTTAAEAQTRHDDIVVGSFARSGEGDRFGDFKALQQRELGRVRTDQPGIGVTDASNAATIRTLSSLAQHGSIGATAALLRLAERAGMLADGAAAPVEAAGQHYAALRDRTHRDHAALTGRVAGELAAAGDLEQLRAQVMQGAQGRIAAGSERAAAFAGDAAAAAARVPAQGEAWQARVRGAFGDVQSAGQGNPLERAQEHRARVEGSTLVPRGGAVESGVNSVRGAAEAGVQVLRDTVGEGAGLPGAFGWWANAAQAGLGRLAGALGDGTPGFDVPFLRQAQAAGDPSASPSVTVTDRPGAGAGEHGRGATGFIRSGGTSPGEPGAPVHEGAPSSAQTSAGRENMSRPDADHGAGGVRPDNSVTVTQEPVASADAAGTTLASATSGVAPTTVGAAGGGDYPSGAEGRISAGMIRSTEADPGPAAVAHTETVVVQQGGSGQVPTLPTLGAPGAPTGGAQVVVMPAASSDAGTPGKRSAAAPDAGGPGKGQRIVPRSR